MSASLILKLIALLCFVLAAIQWVPSRGNLIAAGLAFWVGSELV